MLRELLVGERVPTDVGERHVVGRAVAPAHPVARVGGPLVGLRIVVVADDVQDRPLRSPSGADRLCTEGRGYPRTPGRSRQQKSGSGLAILDSTGHGSNRLI